MALTDKLRAIGNGFRSSRGTTKEYSLAEMAVLAAEKVGGGKPLIEQFATDEIANHVLCVSSFQGGMMEEGIAKIAIAPEIQASTADKSGSPSSTTFAKGGTCYIQGSGSWWYRTFLKYDLSGVPADATIISAKMKVYDVFHNTNGASGTTNISRITTEWDDDSVSWNNQPSWEGTYLSANVSPPGVGKWSDWDITTLVQMWLDGTYPNYGVYIQNNNEGSYRYDWQIANHYHSDTSLASYLEIYYEE